MFCVARQDDLFSGNSSSDDEQTIIPELADSGELLKKDQQKAIVEQIGQNEDVEEDVEEDFVFS